MSTVNPFDLLGDDDNDDPLLIAAQQQKIVAKKADPSAAAAPATAKMPSKPLPPSQAVREAKSNSAAPRGGGSGRGGGFGRGRGGRSSGNGQPRDFGNETANGFTGNYGDARGGEGENDRRPSDRERGPYYGPRQSFRGGQRGGYGNEESGGDLERPRRTYERRSGTGRGFEMKRDGAGRGNWGSATDDAITQETENNSNAEEKIASPEKQPSQENALLTEVGKDNKEGQVNEAEEKEEDKEMTLEEYEKIREEKRKVMLAMKTEERKVEIDNELKSMQQLSKKENEDIFVKLGSGKEKKKENGDKDEKVKKSLSINEFLKPEGGRYYSPGGRGRGRGRGDRGLFRGGFGGGATLVSAPSIEDPGQFPTLGGK